MRDTATVTRRGRGRSKVARVSARAAVSSRPVLLVAQSAEIASLIPTLQQVLITQGVSRSALCRSGDRGAVITWSRSVRIPQVTADALPQPSRDRIATHDTEIETCRDFFLLSGHLSSRCRDCLLEPGGGHLRYAECEAEFQPGAHRHRHDDAGTGTG